MYAIADSRNKENVFSMLVSILNKNNKLYQGSTNCHIYWSHGLREKSSCFRFDRRKYNKYFDYIILFVQRYDGIRHIIQNVGSGTIAMLGL